MQVNRMLNLWEIIDFLVYRNPYSSDKPAAGDIPLS